MPRDRQVSLSTPPRTPRAGELLEKVLSYSTASLAPARPPVRRMGENLPRTDDRATTDEIEEAWNASAPRPAPPPQEEPDDDACVVS